MADAVTYDYSAGGTANVYGVSGAMSRPVSVITRVMDAAAIIAKDGGTHLASASQITAAESITAITLPIGFLVCGVVTYVIEAGTAGGTIDIGTPENEQGLDSAVDIATADTWTYTATDAYGIAGGGKVITARSSDYDQIIVQYNAAETTGKFVIAVWGIDFSDLLNAQ